jgi:hypothetical protein
MGLAPHGYSHQSFTHFTMNSFVALHTLSLKQTVKTRIFAGINTAIRSCFAALEAGEQPFSIDFAGLEVKRIPGHKLEENGVKSDDHRSSVLYSSPIALSLAPRLKQKPDAIARQLVRQITTDDVAASEAITWLSHHKWITCDVSGIHLFRWLTQTLDTLQSEAVQRDILKTSPAIAHTPFYPKRSDQPLSTAKDDGKDDGVECFAAPPNSKLQHQREWLLQHQYASDIWLSQYAHARCAAWLRMMLDKSEDAALVSRSSRVFELESARFAQFSPLLSQSASDGQALEQAMSLELLLCLIDSVDDVCAEYVRQSGESEHSPYSEQVWGKTVIKKALIPLSRCVLQYQAEYPVGALCQGDRPLVKAQCLVMQVVQQWLKFLLEDVLNLQAPTQL